jgi:hypothetical protein
MILHKLPMKLQKEFKIYLAQQGMINTLTLEEEIEIFSEELKMGIFAQPLEKVE